MSIIDNPDVNAVNADALKFYRISPGFCLGDSLLNLAILRITLGTNLGTILGII